MAVGIQNPQTWVRLRRNDLRKLANQIGNHAMRHMVQRSIDGANGRPTKEMTEKIMRRLDGQPLSSEINLAFADLQFAADQFRKILADPFYKALISERIIQQAGSDVSTADELVNFYIGDIDNYIDAYIKSLPPPPTPAELIAEVVPDQKVGPAKFKVVDGILRVSHQAAVAETADAHNAETARVELIATSAEIAEYLGGSNVDYRLASTIVDIKHRLSISQDIIQLGIAAISCQMVCEQFEEELPGVWGAKLRAFSVSIGMYVSQFPEWLRFSENAAMADFSQADVQKLHQSGMKLVDGLRAVGPTVDPEVPQTLAFLLEVIKDPRRALKRTVFAALRSIENLVVVVVRAFGNTIGAVFEGARDGGKLVTKYSTATVLLSLIATVAISVSPAAGRILQTNWMHKAGELIVEGLKDVK